MKFHELDSTFLSLEEVVKQYTELLKIHGPHLRTNLTEIRVTESVPGTRAVFAATDNLRAAAYAHRNEDRNLSFLQ